jgi:hypothetical protein
MTPEELLQLKELLVTDAVDAIKAQNDAHQKQIMDLVTPAIAKVDGFEKRIHTLETQKLLVIKGALVYASVVGAIIGSVWGLIKQHFKLNL